jgi:hypothetical protein
MVIMRDLNFPYNHQRVAQGELHDDSVSYQTTNAQNKDTYFKMKNYILRFNQLLTPWSRVLPEKLTVLQLIKKFPAFYET